MKVFFKKMLRSHVTWFVLSFFISAFGLMWGTAVIDLFHRGELHEEIRIAHGIIFSKVAFGVFIGFFITVVGVWGMTKHFFLCLFKALVRA